MNFKKHIPAYPLGLYMEHIIYAQGVQPMPYLMELPDGRLNLMIELQENTTNTLFSEPDFKGKHIMKRGWVSGANAKAVIYENNNNSTIMSIRFAIGGFYGLTKIPMSEIIHPGMEIELLLGNSFNKLYEMLMNGSDIESKFRLIESYFQNYIRDNDFETSVVRFVDKHIDKPIDWLVSKSGYSQKHLIHLLKKQTGFSPKYLQRLQRFHQVAESLQKAGGFINWASIAYEHNYFDQAHFIKDFIHFTGFSPVEYRNIHSATEYNSIITDIQLF